MRLIRTAIAHGWNVPPETRARVIDGLFTAMEGGNVRMTLAVGRTVVAAVGDNIRHEQARRNAETLPE